MKNIFRVLMLSVLLAACTKKTAKLQDGIYLVLEPGTSSVTKNNSCTVRFNPDFVTGSSDQAEITIATTNFVPLALDKKPELLENNKPGKTLLLALDNAAARQLETFTAKHIMKKVVLVVEGEALTVHKVRDTIKEGKLQITRCSDNACSKLSRVLEDNVK